MTATADYLAIDLGASSGRGVLGAFDGRRLTLSEVHRFANGPVTLPSGLHWNTPGLFAQVLHALTIAGRTSGSLAGVGIDTWGVDYGLLSGANELLGLPHHYRDPRTGPMVDAAFAMVARERIYERTGIQFMALNTLYQLLADKQCADGRLAAARSLLFTPDLLHFWLTGVARSEATIASTSQLFDTGGRTWARDLIGAFGLREAIFPEVLEPGSVLGPLLGAVSEETGVRGVSVITPGSHDTASAVAAVPAEGDEGWAYVSSGTWSLVGRELREPLRTPEAMRANFTNECGVEGTIRFHKNVAGLWLLQESRRVWAAQGRGASFEELVEMARTAPAFAAVVDPDHDSFPGFGDMPARIRAYCERTGQRPPDSDAAVVRCILDSLALKCAHVIELLEAFTGPVRAIHIVGGGCRNTLLCQLTANACGRPVLAGPVEATAAGNIMVQAMAQGRVGSLRQVREVIRASFAPTVYEPADGAAWARANQEFRALMTRGA